MQLLQINEFNLQVNGQLIKKTWAIWPIQDYPRDEDLVLWLSGTFTQLTYTYRKCLSKRPGCLFNFLMRGGGANSKVGTYFVFQLSASVIRWSLKSLETVIPGTFKAK